VPQHAAGQPTEGLGLRRLPSFSRRKADQQQHQETVSVRKSFLLLLLHLSFAYFLKTLIADKLNLVFLRSRFFCCVIECILRRKTF
jgi:hypothetical protein